MIARRLALRLSTLSATGSTQPSGFRTDSHAYRKSSPCLVGRASPIFHAARSFSLDTAAPPQPFPVVLLSGFLGAGKTTVLEQLLRDHHGFKLGVVVNDLAAVNVDANVLRDTINNSGTQSVSLANGCVCCTAADDLLESVQSLLRGGGSKELDAIVVELSGVAEPARVKENFEFPVGVGIGWLKMSKALSVRTVTVVDSPSFPADYLREQSSHHDHAHTASGECDERYGALLAEQVESADLLLLNKADVATEEELLHTHVMVKALNETATVRTTEYGKVKVDELLALEAKALMDSQNSDRSLHLEDAAASPDAIAQPKSACCAAKTCSSTNKDSTMDCESGNKSQQTKSRAEARFGITSFVYTTQRLMSQEKLMKQMEHWQKARANLGNKLNLEGMNHESFPFSGNPGQVGSDTTVDSPLAPILRSKGILLLDADPDVAFYWSHAGKSVNFSIFGRWPEQGFGAPRTELVFIGTGYDETSIRDVLNSCLLDG